MVVRHSLWEDITQPLCEALRGLHGITRTDISMRNSGTAGATIHDDHQQPQPALEDVKLESAGHGRNMFAKLSRMSEPPASAKAKNCAERSQHDSLRLSADSLPPRVRVVPVPVPTGQTPSPLAHLSFHHASTMDLTAPPHRGSLPALSARQPANASLTSKPTDPAAPGSPVGLNNRPPLGGLRRASSEPTNALAAVGMETPGPCATSTQSQTPVGLGFGVRPFQPTRTASTFSIPEHEAAIKARLTGSAELDSLLRPIRKAYPSSQKLCDMQKLDSQSSLVSSEDIAIPLAPANDKHEGRVRGGMARSPSVPSFPSYASTAASPRFSSHKPPPPSRQSHEQQSPTAFAHSFSSIGTSSQGTSSPLDSGSPLWGNLAAVCADVATPGDSSNRSTSSAGVSAAGVATGHLSGTGATQASKASMQPCPSGGPHSSRCGGSCRGRPGSPVVADSVDSLSGWQPPATTAVAASYVAMTSPRPALGRKLSGWEVADSADSMRGVMFEAAMEKRAHGGVLSLPRSLSDRHR